MKFPVSTLLALLITACTTSQPKPAPASPGEPAEDKLISCMKVDDCYKQARKICRGDYKILNTSTESLGNKSLSSTNLLIKCGG
jgi:hypothetical protein